MDNEQSRLFPKEYYEILSILGISENEFSHKEIQYINKWEDKLEFPLDVIIEACKMATSISRRHVTFDYIDKLLLAWYNQNIKNVEDLRRELDKEKKDIEKRQKVGHYTSNDRSTNKKDYSKIKHCPFCGGTASLSANYSNRFETWFINVMCEECGSQGKTYTSNEHPEKENWDNDSCKNAINAWNMRT